MVATAPGRDRATGAVANGRSHQTRRLGVRVRASHGCGVAARSVRVSRPPDLTVEPCPGHLPVALDRRGGYAESRRRILDTQPAKETALHDSTLSDADLLEPTERLIERRQLDGLFLRGRDPAFAGRADRATPIGYDVRPHGFVRRPLVRVGRRPGTRNLVRVGRQCSLGMLATGTTNGPPDGGRRLQLVCTGPRVTGAAAAAIRGADLAERSGLER